MERSSLFTPQNSTLSQFVLNPCPHLSSAPVPTVEHTHYHASNVGFAQGSSQQQPELQLESCQVLTVTEHTKVNSDFVQSFQKRASRADTPSWNSSATHLKSVTQFVVLRKGRTKSSFLRRNPATTQKEFLPSEGGKERRAC